MPNPTGSLTYTPDADYSGLDSFAYEVCDGAPMVTLNGPGAANVGDTVTYTYTAVDLEPDLDGGTLEHGESDGQRRQGQEEVTHGLPRRSGG